jgi:hypothetical protein
MLVILATLEAKIEVQSQPRGKSETPPISKKCPKQNMTDRVN